MLTKAINSGKEHRKPYRGAQLIDAACRARICPWCERNRLHATRKRENAAAYIEEEARDEISDRINERDNLYILKV